MARFYTELVPVQIRPEEFWARYFYRNLLLTRNGVVNLDDDDDDDEGWESTEKSNDNTDNSSNNTTTNNNTATIEGRTIHDIYDENINLKKHITSLTLHIAELEKLLEAERSNVKRLMESTLTAETVPQPPRSVSPSSQSVPITTTTVVVEATDANDIISPIEKVPAISAETLSDKSESSSGVLVDMTESVPKVLTPENKAKILASLDNDDDDDDDDEWS